jgi:hypothetical protein
VTEETKEAKIKRLEEENSNLKANLDTAVSAAEERASEVGRLRGILLGPPKSNRVFLLNHITRILMPAKTSMPSVVACMVDLTTDVNTYLVEAGLITPEELSRGKKDETQTDRRQKQRQTVLTKD